MASERADEQLMENFCRGEAEAFEVLMRRHRTAVFNFILRFTGNRASAEDLLQDTWLKVVRKAPEYQPRARFTTWLFTIARNRCLDVKRQELFRRTESLDAPASPTGDDQTSLAERLPSPAASPERNLDDARTRKAIEVALASLPEEQREVFLLREYNGIPFKEIAAITQTSENTVKSRMRYALESLRRRLTELGVNENGTTENQAAV